MGIFLHKKLTLKSKKKSNKIKLQGGYFLMHEQND